MSDINEPIHQRTGKTSLKVKILTFVDAHQVPVILASFILLPVIILGSILLISKLRNRSANEVAVTPTPTVTVKPEPTDRPEEEEEEEPTPSPTKKLTQSPTPKPSNTPGSTNPANTPGPTSLPSRQTNVVFQSVNCMYQPTASSSAEKKKINDTTFANSEVPSTSTCEIEFKNTENDESGDITYAISSDSDNKKITVGKLKKDETKKVTEVVELKKSSGSHYIKVQLNPDKTFSETNYDDNSYQANYTIQ